MYGVAVQIMPSKIGPTFVGFQLNEAVMYEDYIIKVCKVLHSRVEAAVAVNGGLFEK